jgi:hypothetical protein
VRPFFAFRANISTAFPNGCLNPKAVPLLEVQVVDMRLEFADGTEFTLTPQCPTEVALRKVLSKAKVGKVFTGTEVAEIAGCSKESIRNIGNLESLQDLTYRCRGKRFWAHPDTIAEIKRRAEAAMKRQDKPQHPKSK